MLRCKQISPSSKKPTAASIRELENSITDRNTLEKKVAAMPPIRQQGPVQLSFLSNYTPAGYINYTNHGRPVDSLYGFPSRSTGNPVILTSDLASSMFICPDAAAFLIRSLGVRRHPNRYLAFDD
ncbi:hypothetical protein Trydic_g11286 [Trypoxylus dichotomus]